METTRASPSLIANVHFNKKWKLVYILFTKEKGKSFVCVEPFLYLMTSFLQLCSLLRASSLFFSFPIYTSFCSRVSVCLALFVRYSFHLLSLSPPSEFHCHFLVVLSIPHAGSIACFVVMSFFVLVFIVSI